MCTYIRSHNNGLRGQRPAVSLPSRRLSGTRLPGATQFSSPIAIQSILDREARRRAGLCKFLWLRGDDSRVALQDRCIFCHVLYDFLARPCPLLFLDFFKRACGIEGPLAVADLEITLPIAACGQMDQASQDGHDFDFLFFRRQTRRQ